MGQITALVADNQKLFIEGFLSILKRIDEPEIKVVETVCNAGQILDALRKQKVDLLFTELNLPDKDGISLIPVLKEKYPYMLICVLTAYSDHKFVKSALTSGADAYYSKLNSSAELQQCIDDMIAGQTFLSQGLHITPPQRPKNPQTNGKSKFFEDRFLLRQKLTKREQEVLALITKALNNKEIAEKLYISDQTVGVHRKNIMRKLGVRNTVNLIRFAIDHHLV